MAYFGGQELSLADGEQQFVSELWTYFFARI